MAQSPRAVDWAIMHPELPETGPPSPQRGGTSGRLGSHPPAPLPSKVVVAAGVERRLAALQMQDLVDDIVQQIALVADFFRKLFGALDGLINSEHFRFWNKYDF